MALDFDQIEHRRESCNAEELRTKYVTTINKAFSLIDFNRFSSYVKLKRTVGWICRFIHNRFNNPKRCGELDVDELRTAEVVICKIVQMEVYAQDVFDLTAMKSLSKRSQIIKFSPILDDDGVLRVNGRIRRCNAISVTVKQPIIIVAE